MLHAADFCIGKILTYTRHSSSFLDNSQSMICLVILIKWGPYLDGNSKEPSPTRNQCWNFYLTFNLLHTPFISAILNMTVSGFGTLDTIYFCFCVTPSALWPYHIKAIQSVYSTNRVTSFCVIWKLWSKWIALALFIFLSVLLVYLFSAIFSFFYYSHFYCCCFAVVLLIIFLFIILLLLMLFYFIVDLLFPCCWCRYCCFIFIYYHYIAIIVAIVKFVSAICFQFKFLLAWYKWFGISFRSLGAILTGKKFSLYWFYCILKCKKGFMI